MNIWTKIVITWILFIIVSFSGVVYAATPVRVVVDAYNPPNMYLQNGHAAGLYSLLLDAIFQHMEHDVSIEAVPWKRAMDMGAQGTAGVAGIYKTPDRLLIYDYSDPIYTELLLVFVQKNKTFTFESVKDLEGKRIGVILGWSYGPKFDKARAQKTFEVEPVNRDQLNFKKLMDGRLDCVVASRESGFYEIARKKHTEILPLPKSLLSNPTYLAFAKHTHKKDFLMRFNAALRALKESGEYELLVKDFMHEIDFHTIPVQ
nr:transporter substrate-binding domain-containing protein [Pseudodesulfovibrio sp.]